MDDTEAANGIKVAATSLVVAAVTYVTVAVVGGGILRRIRRRSGDESKTAAG